MYKKSILWIFVFITLISCVFGALTDNNNVYYSLDDGSGITDLSGNGNDGNNFGATTGVTGIINQAFDFDGTDYVSVSKTVLSSTSFSVNMWINPDSITSPTEQHIFASLDSGANSVINFRVRADRIELYIRGDSGTGQTCTATTTINNAVWKMVTLSIDNGNIRIYENGVSLQNCTKAWTGTISLDNNFFIGARDNAGSPDSYFYGKIDEFGFWNGKALSDSEADQLYNSGNGYNPYSAIPTTSELFTFINQTPSDLTSLNAFGIGLNITYNISNTSFSNEYLNYTINTTTPRCLIYENETCTLESNKYNQQSSTSNTTNIFSYYFEDNMIYPATYTYNESLYEQLPKYEQILSNQQRSIKIKINNVTNKQYSFFEIWANQTESGTANLNFYYCNNSYSSGIITSSPYCTIFYELDYNTPYNHTHNNNESHHVIPFPITSGKINNITITPTSYFIVAPSTALGNWSVYYANVTAQTTTSQFSSSLGASWSTQNRVYDAHLHQFDSSDILYYKVCANYSGVINCSLIRSDSYELEILPPTAVNILTPTENENITINYNITYTASINQSPIYYNISLLNSDLTFNQTIIGNNSNNTYYLWNIYNYSIDTGYYYIQVAVHNTHFNTVKTISPIFYIRHNKALNISVNNNVTGSLLSNFNGWIYNYDTGENYTYNTGSNSVLNGIVANNDYLIALSKENYTTQYLNYTSNETPIQQLQFSLFTFNSVRINIYNLDNDSLILQPTTITTISNLTTFTNYTTTGSIIIDFLTPNSYELRFNSSNFNSISKFITVLNDSTQQINVFMTSNATSTIQRIRVVDSSNSDLEGAVIWVQKEILNDTQFITIQEVKTDFNGEAFINIIKDPLIYYRFAVIYDGIQRPILPSGNLFTGKTSFLPTIDETIELVVTIEGDIDTTIEDYLGIYGDLYFYNDTVVVFDFTDAQGTIYGAKLVIEAKYNTSLEYEPIETKTKIGQFGSINYTIPQVNGSNYRFSAYILKNNNDELFWEELFKSIEPKSLTDKNTGFLLVAIIIPFMALISLEFGILPSIALIGGMIGFFNLINIINVPFSIISGIIAFGLILFIRFKKNVE